MLTQKREERSSLLIRSLKSPKWEIDLYLYFFIIFLFPASLSERTTTSSFTQFWHWTLVKFIQLIFAYFIFSAVKNFLHSIGRKYFYFYQVTLIGFVGGFASTLVIFFTLISTNFIDTERNYLSFFISNAFMGAVWLPVCCASSVALRKVTKMSIFLRSELSVKVINEIKQSQIYKTAVANEDRITANQIIRMFENSKGRDDVIVDLSAVTSNKGFNRGFKLFFIKDNFVGLFLTGLKSLSVYKYSIKYRPLNPLYFTFVITFIVAISVIKNDPSYRGFLIVSYFAVYTYFFHMLQMFFYKKVKSWIWWVTLCDLLNIAAISITGYLLNKYYDFFGGLNTSMTTTYAVVITLYLFLYFMGHISQSAGIKYERHKSELERYLNSESFKAKILNQELEKDALKWEQIIHGKLQSKVISSSLKKVSVEDRVSADDRFIAEVSDLITESLSDSLQKESNPTLISEEVCRPWNAVIDIQSEIDPSIAKQTLSSFVSKRVHDVLQEAITNAVKHGGAEKVWLVIKAGLNNSLQILVKNDGAPVGKPKRRRIGTNLFNQSGEWSIGNENGLVVFQIQIDA
jgi:hypothetical protein